MVFEYCRVYTQQIKTYWKFQFDQSIKSGCNKKNSGLKIKSQVAQGNEDLIACSVLLTVIPFGIVFTIQPCLK